MLSLTNWKTCSYSPGISLSAHRGDKYDLAIVRHSSNPDDRSTQILDFIRGQSDNLICSSYDSLTTKLYIGNRSTGVFDFSSINFNYKKILLDANSLDVPELLYLMTALHQQCIDFDILYFEPNEYSYTDSLSGDIIQRQFELSNDGSGIDLLPLYTSLTKNSHLVVSIGFEKHRFSGLLSTDELDFDKISSIIGIPPFYTGWERRSFDANLDALHYSFNHYSDNAYKIAGANDPYRSYEIIRRLHSPHASPSNSKPFILAPLSTKPLSISMIWFAINYQGVGIIYDFQTTKVDRSQGLSKMHLWSFTSIC